MGHHDQDRVRGDDACDALYEANSHERTLKQYIYYIDNLACDYHALSDGVRSWYYNTSGFDGMTS